MIIEELACLPHVTHQERAVIELIARDPGIVEHSTAKGLAQAAHTSTPTVTRLCQKLGYRGFADFRLKFVAEWRASSGHIYAELAQPVVGEQTSAADLDELLPRLYNRVAYETARLVNSDAIGRVCRLIEQRPRVDCYAMGLLGGIARETAFKLQTLGLESQAFETVNIQMIKHAPTAAKRCALLFSQTGESAAILDVATRLAHNDVPMVAITPVTDRGIAQSATHVLPTYRTLGADRLSLVTLTLSMRYAIDRLYTGLLAQSFATSMETAQQTFAEFYAEAGGSSADAHRS